MASRAVHNDQRGVLGRRSIHQPCLWPVPARRKSVIREPLHLPMTYGSWLTFVFNGKMSLTSFIPVATPADVVPFGPGAVW